jgi:hypothetical protein
MSEERIKELWRQAMDYYRKAREEFEGGSMRRPARQLGVP